RRLVAGIEQPGLAQPPGSRFIEMGAPRLPLHNVRPDTEPIEIAFDLRGEFLARALDIGVVEAQHIPAGRLPGEQPVEQRGTRIADMDMAGRRRRETDSYGHRASLPASRGRGKRSVGSAPPGQVEMAVHRL